MPLLDHFRPPLSRTHPWRAFHGAWAAAMARLLNEGLLPVGYYALPFMNHDGPVETERQVAKEIRVEVLTATGDPRLAAVVELVSPRNNDWPRARETFAAKCADDLRRGCGLVVVDVVTTRGANLRHDLLTALGADQDAPAGERALSAVAYRSVGG